ncbi:EAL domain-containing protein [Neobacillus sp. PS2-9]|uniref:putative bifunctional diguanylate cyclase/phosphodiesterase n=1 Tax=Neobacillus sp. PS2-9 TaxID=3070676 RepID=UPI0027DF0E30|nr:EAL domain-containing protein [Neobacillus sp. PS2-9]WML57335.1 EAL domain-containing protein [Neobacillus sp. PS2-9]
MNQHSQNGQTLKELQLRIDELEKREVELQKQLRLHTSLHSRVLDALPINVFLEDPEGRTIFANKQACLANGLSLEELVGKTVFDFFPQHIAQLNREIDLEVWEERRLITREAKVGFQGKESIMFSGKTIIELPESGKDFLLGFGLDITDLKKAEKKIEHMAYHDALTGLPNRWFIKAYLEKYLHDFPMGNNQILGVVLLDLDHFKVINDSLGHQAGDALLQAVAERLRDTVGKENILARFGGDEFVLIIPNVYSLDMVNELCDFILDVMKEPFWINKQRFTISPSIGICLHPEHGSDMNNLIKNADLAMYHSKEKGRNCYSLFVPNMKVHAMVRMDMEINLRQALEKQEFVLHYQPKMNLKTGRISGMEALIRWKSDENKLLYPDTFISIAEESGLIVPIGEWVLRKACSECKMWHDAGFDELTVSVNISPAQFQKQNLEEVISVILSETGLPPRALELELTESTVMKEPELAAKILKNLKSLGISISIDDFGTGFSSLSYLKNFPIDTLKIDKSFIMNLGYDEENSAIVTAVIALAHILKLKVVAEGVETLDQLDFLQLGACDLAQGFYISKPVEINSIREMVGSCLLV